MKSTNVQSIYALDFDGVLCESHNELATSSWQAAYLVDPTLMGQQLPVSSFSSYFIRTRPLLEVGYQAVLLALLFQHPKYCKLTPPDIKTVLTTNESFHWSPTQLSHALARARDLRYQSNPNSWAQESTLYPGIAAALKRWQELDSILPFIITKKRRRFTLAILSYNGIDWCPTQLHGLEDGAKEIGLAQLQNQYKQTVIRFVEDRYATLDRVLSCTTPFPLKLNCYLAQWGYTTNNDCEKAYKDTRVQVVSLSDLCSW